MINAPSIQKIVSRFSDQKSITRIFKKNAPAKSSPSVRLACDFGKSKIVFLEVEKKADSLRLNKVQKLERIGDPAKDTDLIKQAFATGGYKTSKVRISVKGQGLVIRFIQCPQMKPDELRSALAFEIDQYIPFKSNEVIWDLHVLDENVPVANGIAMNVLLVAIKKEEMDTTIQIFQAAGLQLEFIDADALASINALEYFQPQEFKTSTGILDMGAELSTLSIVSHGKPRFIRDISFGGSDMIKRLKRKLNMTVEDASEQIKSENAVAPEVENVLKEALNDLVSDLKLSMSYYADQVPSATPLESLFISSSDARHAMLVTHLQEKLSIPVRALEILSKIEISEAVDKTMLSQNPHLLPIPLGLALRES